MLLTSRRLLLHIFYHLRSFIPCIPLQNYRARSSLLAWIASGNPPGLHTSSISIAIPSRRPLATRKYTTYHLSRKWLILGSTWSGGRRRRGGTCCWNICSGSGGIPKLVLSFIYVEVSKRKSRVLIREVCRFVSRKSFLPYWIFF